MLSQRRNERRRRAWRMTELGLAVVIGLLPVAVWAAADSTSTTPAVATVASVGLLPIHGILVDLDALPGGSDGKGKGKGKDKNKSAGDDFTELQQLWDSYLKGAGFNVLYLAFDVHDLGDRGAGRLARLCLWSKQNNVRLAPVLAGAAEGQPLPADYATLAASFVGKVIANLGAANLASYSQIMFFQLERPLNQPASHGAIEPSAAQALLKSAAESVRAAEQAGLASSGLQPSPLLVSASFDYELIRRGAIVHTPITDETYDQAYGALKEYLLTVLGAAPVEAVSVEWFPGSLSSEGVDRLTDLVTKLQGDLPGKLLVIDTGYSSAPGDSAQARYYAVALNNLCDLRAKQGVDSPFAGIVWRSAVDGSSEAKPLTADQAAKENWGERANQVTQLWNNPKSDAKEARSWLAGVQSHYGLLARAGSKSSVLAPKTAYSLMSKLETSLAQSPEAADALAAVKEIASGQGGSVGQAIKTRLQSAMFGMLDAWLSKTAENLFTPENESAPIASGPGLPPELPDLQIIGFEVPATLTAGVGTTIPITLFNAGAGLASDAVVYLRDKEAADLGSTNPTSLSPGGSTTIQLQWTPPRSGALPGVSLEAFCSHDPDLSLNHAALGDLQIAPGSKPPFHPHFDASLLAGATKATMTFDSKSSNPPPPSSSPGATTTYMATKTGSGFASIEAVQPPTVMMMSGAPTGSGSPTTSARTIAPAATPVTMTIVNPFGTIFREVVATLRVNGATVATRPLGTLLPKQRRTVSFTGWSPPSAGSYQLLVELAGLGLLGNRLTSSASSQFVVSAEGTAARVVGGGDELKRPASSGARSFNPLLRTASSQPVLGAGLGMPGSSGVRTFSFGPVLGMSANNIVLTPFPPVAGAPLTVSVRLANLERTPVTAAKVQVSVDGQPLGETVTDVPASGQIVASGFPSWMAKPGRHDFRAAVVLGTRKSEATKPVFVNAAGTRGFGHPLGGAAAGGSIPAKGNLLGARTFEAGRGVTMSGVPGVGPGPDLQLGNADIRFAPPVPSAGTPLVVSVTVHNLGAAVANDGRVIAVLTADGREVARHPFVASVPAHGAVTLQWTLTAPSGVIAVSATASATGDANPGNNQARAAASLKVPIKTFPRTGVTTTTIRSTK